MIHASKVLVIAASVRPNRLAPQIAAWAADIGRPALPLPLELVDLKDWPLPMDDEPGIPARGAYAFAHTREWSEKVQEGAGFVFVTPQYNWGYPAALKNALDHLYAEWAGKPAVIVSYGGHGGVRCAEQLRQVLTGLKMKPVATMPALTLPRAQIESDSGFIDAEAVFGAQRPALAQAYQELNAALA